MSKVTLSALANLQNDTTATTAINANSTAITTAIDNTLSRDGTSPNTMSAQLDMNSNKIINLAAPTSNSDAARYADIGAATSASAAAVISAAAAAASAVTSASSASGSGTSATAAATSASAASTSASAASTSASAASTSASAASTSASAAAASAISAANNVGGNLYAFASSTTMADPSTGNIRANNATLASATALALSYSSNDSGNPNIGSYLNTWDDSTNTLKGYVTLRKSSSPANYQIYSISALTDNTTWVQLTVAQVAGSGSFTAADTLAVSFYRTGDKGADGAGSISGGTIHGVAVMSGSTAVGSSVVLTNGQLVVGQTGADPQAKTIGGDLTLASSGSVTLANSASAKTNLGLAIGTNVQAWDADLDTLSAWGNWKLPYSNGTGVPTFVGLGATGTALVSTGATAAPTAQAVCVTANNLSDVASTTTARTSLGLGSSALLATASSAEFLANTASRALSTDPVWGAAAATTLTDAGSVSVDMSLGIDFVWTIGATGRTINNPTNAKNGQKGIIYLVQDATGSRTITTWGSTYKFPGGTKPTLSTSANAVDMISYAVKTSGTAVECFFSGNLS